MIAVWVVFLSPFTHAQVHFCGDRFHYLPLPFHGAHNFASLRLVHTDRPNVFDIIAPELPRMQANQIDAFKTKHCLLKCIQLQRQKLGSSHLGWNHSLINLFSLVCFVFGLWEADSTSDLLTMSQKSQGRCWSKCKSMSFRCKHRASSAICGIVLGLGQSRGCGTPCGECGGQPRGGLQVHKGASEGTRHPNLADWIKHPTSHQILSMLKVVRVFCFWPAFENTCSLC